MGKIILTGKQSDFLKIVVAAAGRGDLEAVQALVEADPRWVHTVGSHGRTMLWEAAYWGKQAVAEFLSRTWRRRERQRLPLQPALRGDQLLLRGEGQGVGMRLPITCWRGTLLLTSIPQPIWATLWLSARFSMMTPCFWSVADRSTILSAKRGLGWSTTPCPTLGHAARLCAQRRL